MFQSITQSISIIGIGFFLTGCAHVQWSQTADKIEKVNLPVLNMRVASELGDSIVASGLVIYKRRIELLKPVSISMNWTTYTIPAGILNAYKRTTGGISGQSYKPEMHQVLLRHSATLDWLGMSHLAD